MTNLSVHKPFDIADLAAAARPFVRRLLPGGDSGSEPIPVDVRVRSYGDSLPVEWSSRSPRPQTGTLPVGTLLDCYL